MCVCVHAICIYILQYTHSVKGKATVRFGLRVMCRQSGSRKFYPFISAPEDQVVSNHITRFICLLFILIRFSITILV